MCDFVQNPGSTINTKLHDTINPKDCWGVETIGDSGGFLQFLRVVSRDYGKPLKPFWRNKNKLDGSMFFVFLGMG